MYLGEVERDYMKSSIDLSQPHTEKFEVDDQNNNFHSELANSLKSPLRHDPRPRGGRVYKSLDLETCKNIVDQHHPIWEHNIPRQTYKVSPFA
jgi:hypothetical protein